MQNHNMTRVKTHVMKWWKYTGLRGRGMNPKFVQYSKTPQTHLQAWDVEAEQKWNCLCIQGLRQKEVLLPPSAPPLVQESRK